MSRPASPLPEPFSGWPFSTAQSTAAGVSRRRTRAKDLSAPFYGVRAPVGTLSVQQRCIARAVLLPAYAAFSHVTAAQLHRLPLPLALRDDSTLHVTVPTGHRAPQGKGTKGHQKQLADTEVERAYGVRVTTETRTLCDLAGILTVPQLVAVGDHLIRRGVGAIARLTIEEAVATYADPRNTRMLQRMAEMLDEDSESPKESELRALIVLAGFAKPQCQVTVFDERRRFVGRVDLAYPDLRIAIEYEGDHHREKDQWRRDIARRRRLEALGWTYLSVTQSDLDDSSGLLRDLASAIARSVAAR